MFKSRFYILVFFSLFTSSENIDFDNLEIWEKSIGNKLIDEYKLLHDAWLLEKPVKDIWQKENEYLEILNIWRDNPPRISKMVKQKLDIKIGCDQELSKYGDVCYNVEDEAILAFDGIRIPIARDFMRENFENISIYFIEEAVVTARKKEESAQDVPVALTAMKQEQLEILKFRKPTHYVILNNEGLYRPYVGSIGERYLKPIFKVAPIYPRRAQERGIMGYAIVQFTVTNTGSVEDAVAIEGYCSNRDPNDPATEFRPCTMFNGASERAALKLKFMPVIFNGQTVGSEGIFHRFTYILDES